MHIFLVDKFTARTHYTTMTKVVRIDSKTWQMLKHLAIHRDEPMGSVVGAAVSTLWEKYKDQAWWSKK